MSDLLAVFLKNEAAIKRLIARVLRRDQVVDDLAQEAFLNAVTAQMKQTVQQPKPFLFRIARNLALNERKRMAARMTDYLDDLEHPEAMPSSAPSIEQCVDDQRQLSLFAQAILTLPKQCRRAFVLRKVDGLAYAEIADLMGISVKTVEKHVAAGLAGCMHYLRQHGCEMGSMIESAPVTAPRRQRVVMESVDE